MKRIRIAYKLSKMTSKPSADKQTFDTAEKCIALSVNDSVATELLAGKVSTAVQTWLNNLSELQGYQNASFCSAELESEEFLKGLLSFADWMYACSHQSADREDFKKKLEEHIGTPLPTEIIDLIDEIE
jgi:hypothetical protein